MKKANKKKVKWGELFGGICLFVAFCALVVAFVANIPTHATSMFWRP